MKKFILEIFLFLVYCFSLYSFIFMNTQSTTDQRTAFAVLNLICFSLYYTFTRAEQKIKQIKNEDLEEKIYLIEKEINLIQEQINPIKKNEIKKNKLV
jgi:hypothetical protein